MKKKSVLLHKSIPALLLALMVFAGAAAAAGGAGTAEDPYVIETAAELQSIQNDLSAYYVLAQNIDLAGVTWAPIGTADSPFFGTLDGRGYTISNMAINQPEVAYAGLFGVISSGAHISNIKFADCTILGYQNVGLLYGRCNGASATAAEIVIENIDAEDCTVSAGSYNVGGIAGSNGNSAIITISDCDVDNCLVESTGSYTVGGIAGYLSIGGSTNALVEDCTVSNSEIRGTASGSSHVGGIAGYLSNGGSPAQGTAQRCTVSNCYVWAGSTYVGGIAGYLSYGGSVGNAYDCVVEDCVIESTGSSIVGGIAGFLSYGGSGSLYSQGLAEDCTVRNCVMSGSNYVGGIAGFLSYSGSTGNVNDCIVEDCTVRAKSSYAGGIAGCKYAAGFGDISGSSVSNTAVRASSFAGGICSTFSRA